ncbi:MAG: RNA polymerase factor sigma-54 [Lachnospiraceae bacterium]|nr:RNA polymerase factor sigma-54 [Lachnospiraceae bacterium]
MRLNAVQFQKQEQHQRASQKMIQSLGVLQMSQTRLKEYLQEAYESNPLLEMAECGGDAFCCNAMGEHAQSDIGDTLRSSAQMQQTFVEYLYEQLMFLPNIDEEQRVLCKYLILCLDHKGYLVASLEELALRVGTDQLAMEEALFCLQQLEPAGVGARSLEECLLIQAKRDVNATEHVYRLIEEHLDLMVANDMPAIAKALDCTITEATEAYSIVRGYCPIPSDGFSDGEDVAYCIPEAEIIAEGNTVTIHLNRSFLPRLTYSGAAQEMIVQAKGQTDPYLKQCQRAAETVLSAMQERENTMRLLLEYVVGYQKEYFIHRAPLQPLTMKAVAKALSVHPSTITRAVADKYVLYQGTTIPLRRFFVSQAKSGTSSDCIKKQICILIEQEKREHPYSDEQLEQLLSSEQMVVSRRTIAKYRKELGIPAAHGRKTRTKDN